MMKSNMNESEIIGSHAKLMVIYCTAILMVILAGCSHTKASQEVTPRQKYMDDIRTLVDKEIPDHARADKIVALMEQLSSEVMDLKQRSVSYQQEFARLNADYSTTPEMLQKVIDEAHEYRMESRKKIMDDYFELKSLMSKEEWEAVSKGDVKAMSEYLKASEESAGQ